MKIFSRANAQRREGAFYLKLRNAGILLAALPSQVMDKSATIPETDSGGTDWQCGFDFGKNPVGFLTFRLI
jgi:hypothetical protein